MKSLRMAAPAAVLILFNLSVFPQATSEELYRFVTQMSEVSRGSIWPGFDPSEFTELKEGSLRFSPELKNPNSPVFMSLADGYFAAHTLEEDIAITFHEAFHGFQRSPSRKGIKWGAENAFLVFEYETASPRNNALFAVEARLLKRALETTDPNMLRRLVSEFLVIRRMRQSELDPKFVSFEKGAELNEGLAEYAGTKAVLEAFRTGMAAAAGLAFKFPDGETYLRSKYEALETVNTIGSNVRRKFYLTGSAQAFLLDRLMPGKWKDRVQMDGANVQDLLAESIDGRASILELADFDSILQTEEKAARERKERNRQLLQDTVSAEGMRIEVDFSALGGLNYIQQFDPMNVTMVESDIRVHTRMVSFGKQDVFGAYFGRPVVEDLSKKRYVTVADGSLKIVVDGVLVDPERPGETGFDKGLTLSADGIEITARKGRVAVAPGRVSVVVLE